MEIHLGLLPYPKENDTSDQKCKEDVKKLIIDGKN
jgi:hypothetical protein